MGGVWSVVVVEGSASDATPICLLRLLAGTSVDTLQETEHTCTCTCVHILLQALLSYLSTTSSLGLLLAPPIGRVPRGMLVLLVLESRVVDATVGRVWLTTSGDVDRTNTAAEAT